MKNKKNLTKENLVDGLVFGLVAGLVVGLVFGLVAGLADGLVYSLVVGLLFGLVVGLLFGLVTQLIALITNNPLFSAFDLISQLVLLIIVQVVGWSLYFKFRVKGEK